MATIATPRLRLFAGPNGSGKSALLDGVRGQFNLGVYVMLMRLRSSWSGNGFCICPITNWPQHRPILRHFWRMGKRP